ncbi:MAG: hypothetical protein UR51_C0023G0013 [Candidatus Moranbacteria bacterium GW2011_GWF1_34_10]|nr:MAG: hypothetical protein UR51_C0023G0013 [Candidatus Moranbacteria bacterium GW2011_GWF1_34_10]
MRSKKILLMKFLSIIFLIMPFFVFAQYGVPTGTGLPESDDLSDIIISIMNWLLLLVGVIGIIGFVISGILYMTAAGDSNQIDRAKTAMTWSIVGVIVALMGYVIIKAADSMLEGSFF